MAMRQPFSMITCRLLVAMLGLIAFHPSPATAVDSSLVDAIERDLSGGGRTKRGEPANSTASPKIDALFAARKKRGRNLQDDNELYEATRNLPQRDFEINFEFNSSAITDDAKPILDALGEALSREQLAGNRIVIYGHTDKVGSWDYNKKLSQDRADEVARYLSNNFKIGFDNLYAVGFSFDKLKNPAEPKNPENRRVQIVNAGDARPDGQ